MSSFNINGPSGNRPQIQEAQNMKNNGGGGNLGYMKAGDKKKKKKGSDIDPKILDEGAEDKFEHVDDEEEDDDDYYKVDPDDKFEGSKGSSKEDKEEDEEKDDEENDKEENLNDVKNKVKGAFGGFVDRVKTGVDRAKNRNNKDNIFNGTEGLEVPEVEIKENSDELDLDFNSDDDDNPPSGGFLSLSNKK